MAQVRYIKIIFIEYCKLKRLTFFIVIKKNSV